MAANDVVLNSTTKEKRKKGRHGAFGRVCLHCIQEIARLQDELAKATADLQRSSQKPDELHGGEQDQQQQLKESASRTCFGRLREPNLVRLSASLPQEQAQRDLQEKCKVG